MAYIVARPNGRWEVRESRSTPAGPRSRTLASFTRLSPVVVERAVARAHGHLTGAQLRRLAARAGAPVEGNPADEAAATLLAEYEAGRLPSPARRRMLAAAISDRSGPATHAERAVAPWLTATLEQRGEALRDLLELADRIPARRRSEVSRFPRLTSEAA